MRPRLVCLVEGVGEGSAVPTLVKRVVSTQHAEAWTSVTLDEQSQRLGDYSRVSARGYEVWTNSLRRLAKRADFGGALLVLDGDCVRGSRGEPFCAAKVARELGEAARGCGGGVQFSVAIVFACQEFESWFIAGLSSLAGKKLSDGRDGVIATAECVAGDNVESGPRDAKGWLRDRMIQKVYKPTTHQAELAKLLDVNDANLQKVRSFRRFQSAVGELISAVTTNQHVITPGG
jgi:hypothetical protein